MVLLYPLNLGRLWLVLVNHSALESCQLLPGSHLPPSHPSCLGVTANLGLKAHSQDVYFRVLSKWAWLTFPGLGVLLCFSYPWTAGPWRCLSASL